MLTTRGQESAELYTEIDVVERGFSLEQEMLAMLLSSPEPRPTALGWKCLFPIPFYSQYFLIEGSNSLVEFDSQRLPLVGAQGPCSLPIAVAFGAILLAVAGLAVDLFPVHSYGGAVEVLFTDHWRGTRGMSLSDLGKEFIGHLWLLGSQNTLVSLRESVLTRDIISQT